MKKILFSLFLVLLMTAPAFANLLTNGSFETGNWTSTTSYQDLAAGSTDLTDWTIGSTGTKVVWIDDTTTPGAFQAQEGTNYIYFFSQTGTISQTFDTTVGSTYNFSLWVEGPHDPYHNTSGILAIAVAGRNYKWNGAVDAVIAWENLASSFIATDSQSTISFTFLGEGADGYLVSLDNVSVELAGGGTTDPPINTPEPSSLLLLSAGFVGVGFLRRRVRK